MALPVSFAGAQIRDYDNESTTWQVAVTDLNATNLAAQLTAITALNTAVAGLIIGNTTKEEITLDRSINSTGPSSNKNAQREAKWLVRYHGVTLNKQFQMSIGTCDLSKLPTGIHTDLVDITTGPGKAFADAFAAVVVSPDDSSEATIVDSIQHVGRNT